MRPPSNNPVGTAAQSAAKAQFWVCRRTGAPPAVSELLDQVLSEPGVRVGLAVSETLTDDESHANLEPLLRRLPRHPSAVVRWRGNHALSRMSR